jgi:hypothetical protein
MKPPRHATSARQHSGGLSTVPGQLRNSNGRQRSSVIADLDLQISELGERSTEELRLAWQETHGAEPPRGLSRDLLIRALVHQLQEQSYGGTGRALRRRLQTLTGEREKSGASFDPAIVLKTGSTLVRQWRGHTHAVFVRDDGFEYEGERYRSLSVIAKRITGAHWSGPRFFGLTKPAGASAAAEADS